MFNVRRPHGPCRYLLVLYELWIDDRMWLMNCANCEREIDPDEPSIAITGQPAGDVIGNLCEHCTTDVRTMKIVLKRDDGGTLQFEQYLPVEMMK